jgi:hypothetical protein
VDRGLDEVFFDSTRTFLPISRSTLPNTSSCDGSEIMNSRCKSAFFCFGLPIAVVVLCSDELAERDPADGRHWDWLGGSFNKQ